MKLICYTSDTTHTTLLLQHRGHAYRLKYYNADEPPIAQAVTLLDGRDPITAVEIFLKFSFEPWRYCGELPNLPEVRRQVRAILKSQLS